MKNVDIDRFLESTKIALCVPDYLGDLWVCGRKTTSSQALSVSQMRAGPLGLTSFSQFDYYLLKTPRSSNAFLRSQENDDVEERKRDAELKGVRGWRHELCKMPRVADYSVDPGIIDCKRYDVVMVINDCLPYSTRRKYKDTIFIAIPEDGILPPRFYGYDGIITQYTSRKSSRVSRLLDVPYTLVQAMTIEEALLDLGRDLKREKRGLFLEINQFTTRPPSMREAIRILGVDLHREYGYNLHQEYIVDNLTSISNSLFFVKLTGRPIRGNSVYESVSAGCPVLVNPGLLIDSFPLPPTSFISSKSELEEILRNKNLLGFRSDLLSRQRELLEWYGFDESLKQIQSLVTLRQATLAQNRYARTISNISDSIKLLMYKHSLSLLQYRSSWL